MGIFSRINPQKILDGVGKFIDANNETRQEVVTGILEHYKTSLNESTPRSLTRRYIAVSVVGVELGILIGAGVAYPFSPDYAQFLLDLATKLFPAFITVLIFYFGGYYGDKFIRSRRERKAEDKRKLKESK